LVDEKLEYMIGRGTAVIPFLIFIIITIVLSFLKAPSLNMMIAAAIIGLIVGMFFCKDWRRYWDEVLTGMGSKLAMTAVMIWLVVGIYAGILGAGRVVDGLAWGGNALGITGSLFTLFTFLACMMFATATGTSLGTIAAMGVIMYPAGLLLGANPIFLAGAILSGAAFGDNIAPVSDTTIISAISQEYQRRRGTAEIGGVVRSRFKYAIISAVIAMVLYTLVGGGGTLAINPTESSAILAEHSYPPGLLMLISAAIVIFLAVKGKSIFVALTGGIISAVAIGIPVGLFSISDIIRIEGTSVQGVIPAGVAGMLTVSILLIVVVAMGHLLIKSGCMETTVGWVGKNIAKSPRSNELSIWGLATVFNILIAAINTIAIICVAPFINAIGKKHKLHPYRRANIMDATTCTWPFFLPYGGAILLLIGTMNVTAQTYSFVTPLAPTSMFFAVFYSWVLWFVMLISIVVGYGREFEGRGGRRIKAWFQNKVPTEAGAEIYTRDRRGPPQLGKL